MMSSLLLSLLVILTLAHQVTPKALDQEEQDDNGLDPKKENQVPEDDSDYHPEGSGSHLHLYLAQDAGRAPWNK